MIPLHGAERLVFDWVFDTIRVLAGVWLFRRLSALAWLGNNSRWPRGIRGIYRPLPRSQADTFGVLEEILG
jgi:hypothetical protein